MFVSHIFVCMHAHIKNLSSIIMSKQSLTIFADSPLKLIGVRQRQIEYNWYTYRETQYPVLSICTYEDRCVCLCLFIGLV